jgi:protein SCO1
MSKRWLSAVVALLSGLGILLVLLLKLPNPATLHGSVMTPPYPAPDIQLVDQRNQPFHLSDLHGQAVLLYFGYTNCPDECPRAMATFKQLRMDLSPPSNNSQPTKVSFVFVTVDPERDNPAVMASFLDQFDPEIIGLTGNPDRLASVWQAYGVYQENDAGLVGHTDRIFLIDPRGQVRSLYASDVPASDILADLNLMRKGG